jgi:hypothetical protein
VSDSIISHIKKSNLVSDRKQKPANSAGFFVKVEMAGIEPASERLNHSDIYKRRQLLILPTRLQLPKDLVD